MQVNIDTGMLLPCPNSVLYFMYVSVDYHFYPVHPILSDLFTYILSCNISCYCFLVVVVVSGATLRSGCTSFMLVWSIFDVAYSVL